MQNGRLRGITDTQELLQPETSEEARTRPAEATRGVQLLVDIFHMLRNGESADDILKVSQLVRHVHVAENKDRAAPGIHGDNFRGFFRALRRANYNGRLTVEADWTDLPNQVAPTLAALRTQLRDCGY